MSWKICQRATTRLRRRRARRAVPADPGLHVHLTFDPAQDVAAVPEPRQAQGRRAARAGVNSHVEMAYAFTEAGFEATTMHMTDLQTGRADWPTSGRGGLRRLQLRRHPGRRYRLARVPSPSTRCWPSSSGLLRARTPSAWACATAARCLPSWPTSSPARRTGRASPPTRARRFEARLSLVEVLESPSLFLQGMAGSRLPIAVAHGEGYANFKYRATRRPGHRRHALRGQPCAAHRAVPFNPNGSPGGLTVMTTADGRFTAMMPHPSACSQHPDRLDGPCPPLAPGLSPGCACGAMRVAGWADFIVKSWLWRFW